MPNITLFEHETIPFPWTERHLALLRRVNRAAPILMPTVRGKERVLQAAQYVGMARFGDQTVQILPKIYRDASTEATHPAEATQNLLSMLKYAGMIHFHKQSIMALLRRESDWFEILTRLFALQLTEMWQRGPTRRYETQEEELPVLRGKLRLAVQLRQPERKHRFAVAYDAFTADNALNQIFRFVVERLLRLTHDTENRRLLAGLQAWMADEVTLRPTVTAAEADPNLLTRLNHEAEPLLNLSRLFLDGGALQLTSGDLNAYAFVFDMNQLFEAFIIHFIRRHRDAILPPELQSCVLQPQSRGTWFHLAQTEGRPVFRLQPDLVFRQGERFPLLLDTKYKRLDPAERKLGIAQDDFYQMHAYAHRYHCPRVLLLYPRTAELCDVSGKQFALKEASGKTIEVALVNIQRDVSLLPDRHALIAELRAAFTPGALPFSLSTSRNEYKSV